MDIIPCRNSQKHVIGIFTAIENVHAVKIKMDLPLYEQQLRDVERGIENVLNAIQQGILTKSTKARLEDLEEAKADLEIRIANEKLAKPKISEDQFLHFLHKFQILDISKPAHRQRLIDTFVNRIYIYEKYAPQ